MATFANKEEYPEANGILGAGKNTNTIDVHTFRNREAMIHKVMLDDDDLKRLNENKCLYLWFKGAGATHAPMQVLTGSPFVNLTEEQIQAEIEKDVVVVNERLRASDVLERIKSDITHAQAIALNMRWGVDWFIGCEYLKKKISEQMHEAIEGQSLE
jgi:hypothetical protein